MFRTLKDVRCLFIAKRTLLLVFVIAIYVFSAYKNAFAYTPYNSITIDKYGNWVPQQAPFIPERLIEDICIVEGNEGGQETVDKFKSPEDIFICSNDILYVADTGNNRIVKMKLNGEVIDIIGGDTGDNESSKSALNGPEGVFADEKGWVYVADTGNSRIAVYDENGKYRYEIKGPEASHLPKDYVFTPLKVAIDNRDYMYVVTKAGYYGLTKMNLEGKFETFFGSNKVNISWIEKIRRLFYTKEQLRMIAVKLPGTITNLFIGNDNFVYTCTANLSRGQIKKFNVVGEDIFNDKELETARIQAVVGERPFFVDVAVDKSGNIACLDTVSGRIYIYDSNGEPLFAFGRVGTEKSIKGVFGYPSSICFDSRGYLYVADSRYSYIHVFKPTEFGKLVIAATTLYNDGKYLESIELWRNVLKLNSNYFKAHTGIGKAYYKNKQWVEAMNEFKISKNTKDYSDAFLRFRIEWTKKYFGYISTALVLVFAVYLAMNLARRSRFKKVKEFEKRERYMHNDF